MIRLNNEGFGVIEALLLLIIVGIIGGTGFYVYNANKSTSNGNENTIVKQDSKPEEPKTTKDPNEDYLVIKEWGVKIPLTNLLKSARYEMHNKDGYAQLLVDIDGDSAKNCSNEASIVRIDKYSPNAENFRERTSDLDENASKIGNVYYRIEPSQAACSDNEAIQDQATKIRSDWTDQAKLIKSL